MNNYRFGLFGLVSLLPTFACAQTAPPLKAIRTISLPEVKSGSFDHLGIDGKRGRLFVTSSGAKAVLVIDLASGKVIHQIGSVTKPHAVLYRADQDRVYVTDGGTGDLKTFEGADYHPGPTVRLQVDADSIGFDRATQTVYVDNGGRDAGSDTSVLSFIDTAKLTKTADLGIEGHTLEAMSRELFRPRLYVNNKARNQIAVVNTFTQKQIASWPVAPESDNVAMALDERHRLLFIGCRTGKIAVLDTDNGRYQQSLSIPKLIDDLAFDSASGRMYAAGDGHVTVYEEQDRTHFNLLANVPTGPAARTALLVPSLSRYFVAVPGTKTSTPKILVYEIPTVEKASPAAMAVTAAATLPIRPVPAPAAQSLVLATMSAHPEVLRLGLHAIPLGEREYEIIAQGFPFLIGKKSNGADLKVINTGETLLEREDDVHDYSVELALSDSSGRRIGLLVFGLPYSAASTDSDAIQLLKDIRREMEAQIPSRESLFAPSSKVR